MQTHDLYDNGDGIPVMDDPATARKCISRSYPIAAEGEEDALEVSGVRERVISCGLLWMEYFEGQTMPYMSLATFNHRTV